LCCNIGGVAEIVNWHHDWIESLTMAMRTLLPSGWGSKDVWKTVMTVNFFLESSKGINRQVKDLQEKDLSLFFPISF
jgi:hypothetical protein